MSDGCPHCGASNEDEYNAYVQGTENGYKLAKADAALVLSTYWWWPGLMLINKIKALKRGWRRVG